MVNPSPEDTQKTVLTHIAPAAVGRFNLLEEVRELRSSQQYEATGRTARTLIRGPAFRAMLIVLRRGAELKAHRIQEPEAVQTLLGTIRIDVSGAATEHGPAELIVLEPELARDIFALEDCAFLVSIPWSVHDALAK